MQLSQGFRFWLAWTLANIIGFIIGNFLGATDGGLIPGVAGDSIFGLTFGTAQWLVFSYFLPQYRRKLLWWIVMSAVGFTVGVRLGARFAPMITVDNTLLGIVFGIIVGTAIGIGQSGVMVSIKERSTALTLLPISLLAWVVGESIAFATNFQAWGVPLIGLAIGGITGFGLLKRVFNREL